MKERITRYRVFCPICAGESYVPDWQPGFCPYCGSDMGGYSKESLQAREVTYTVVFNRTREEAAVYWQAS